MNRNTYRSEFLSDEDLELATMSDAELEAWWNYWLELAQATNDEDAQLYTHGVFTVAPATTTPRKRRARR